MSETSLTIPDQAWDDRRVGKQGDIRLETAVERLSEVDFDLFSPALEAMRESEIDVQNAQQHVQRAQNRYLQRQGALQYVFERLAARYQLGPTDEIDREGRILRKEPTDENLFQER